MGKELTKQAEQAIEEILEWFDFGKIHKVMTFLDWKWRDEGVPSHYMLINEARRLLISAYDGSEDGNRWYCASGGFQASCLCYGGECYFSLVFCIGDVSN